MRKLSEQVLPELRVAELGQNDDRLLRCCLVQPVPDCQLGVGEKNGNSPPAGICTVSLPSQLASPKGYGAPSGSWASGTPPPRGESNPLRDRSFFCFELGSRNDQVDCGPLGVFDAFEQLLCAHHRDLLEPLFPLPWCRGRLSCLGDNLSSRLGRRIERVSEGCDELARPGSFDETRQRIFSILLLVAALSLRAPISPQFACSGRLETEIAC